jgi:hypothetical protein
MSRELVLYCDESDQDGQYFSNFYGGCLVESTHLKEVIEALEQCKIEHNLFGEIKWSKVTANYLEKYQALTSLFFDLIKQDKAKVRIMFTKNTHVAKGLTGYHDEYRFFILYYQFVKHAFGLRYANDSDQDLKVRIYFDRLPDKHDKNALFKTHIHNLSNSGSFKRSKVVIRQDQIAEINSHEHVVLQCLDVVLGAIQFRLNDKHLDKPEGQRCRGKRTMAKEKLYKMINRRIQELYPFQFNIGISTGKRDSLRSLWKDPYRHWLFLPNDREYDETKEKPKK